MKPVLKPKMFAKGSRFPLSKAPEVPGPNTYDIHDVEYDAYKRGAFLETADRFTETQSNGSEPGARITPELVHTTNGTNSTKAPLKKTSADRYTMLQYKVEELERIHRDGKRAHQTEVEKLKQELSHAQKANIEQAERYNKLKKQSDSLGSKFEELKKLHDSGQSELKDMRVKLRLAEHERSQLVTKQGEVGEAKKTLQALDLKRRDELRERDKRIADLEKAHATEKRKRELLEARYSEVKGKMDSEVQEAKTHANELEKGLREASSEASRTSACYIALQQRADDTEQELLSQLEQHRKLISRVAEEYGRLACSSIPKAQHDHVKFELASTQLRVCRLDRKLVNSEGQVQDLAQLIRQSKAENTLLQEHLKDAEATVTVYTSALREALNDRTADRPVDRSLHDEFAVIRQAQDALGHAYAQALAIDTTGLLKHLDERDRQLQQQSDQNSAMEIKHDSLVRALSTLRSDHEALQTQLSNTVAHLAEAKSRLEVAKKEYLDLNTRLKSEVVQAEHSLAQEKQANSRLAITVQRGKQAEDALRAEIDELTATLSEAEQYQDAYTNLLTEMEGLFQRNALAEEETQRLSKFNAEIIGHQNPAQRVVYLDRIRRELHDTKQALLATQRDRDEVQFHNDDLRHELQLYKSVTVPANHKPRGHVTRVARMPLGDQDPNTRLTNATEEKEHLLKHLPDSQNDEDLTLEEIL